MIGLLVLLLVAAVAYLLLVALTGQAIIGIVGAIIVLVGWGADSAFELRGRRGR